MVNRSSRTQTGELLRHLLAGRISNLDYEEKAADLDSKASAIAAIFVESWQLYDDVFEHRLTDKWKINKDDRRVVARWILFLQNDLEYEWPYPEIKHDLRRLVSLLTFGVFPHFREPKYRDLGDYDVWPFFCVEDYKQALCSPKLLAGG